MWILLGAVLFLAASVMAERWYQHRRRCPNCGNARLTWLTELIGITDDGYDVHAVRARYARCDLCGAKLRMESGKGWRTVLDAEWETIMTTKANRGR
jgi:hypothetical protein